MAFGSWHRLVRCLALLEVLFLGSVPLQELLRLLGMPLLHCLSLRVVIVPLHSLLMFSFLLLH